MMEELLSQIEKQPDNTVVRIELVKKYIDNHDYESAKAMLEEVIAIEPDHLDANYILAQLYEFDEDYSNALTYLEKVVKQRPTYELIYKLGQLYEHTDKYEEALTLFNECYKLTPDDTNILERIAHVNRILGNTETAIEFYNKLLKNSPDNIIALTQLTELYENYDKLLYRVTKARMNEAEGTLSHALSEYKKALLEAEAPEDMLYIRSSIARILTQQENYLKAVDEYHAILDIDNQNQKVYKSLAEAYLQLDNQEAAAEAYEKALELLPTDETVMKELSDIYIETENFDKALPLLEKLVTVEPNNLAHHNNIAKIYISQNEDQKAEEKLNYILLRDPKNVEAIGILVDFNIIKKDYENAQKYVDEIKKLIPKSPFGYKKAGELFELSGNSFESHYNYGIYHDLKGEKQLAIDEFTWALEEDPQNIEITLKLARLYEDIAEIYIAIEYYQKAVSIDNSNIEALHKMAEIYNREKDYDHAIYAFKELLSAEPNNKDIIFYLATTYENAKKYDLATESYNKFLEIAPYSPKAQEARQRLDNLNNKAEEPEEEGLLDKILGFFKKK